MVYRDGVRDLTLLSKGFDVWNRTVVTNWGVVGLVPGAVRGRPGRGRLADLGGGARTETDGRSGAMSSHIVLEEPDSRSRTRRIRRNRSRRAFLAGGGRRRACAIPAALAYPIYRYLASPEEMASSATAVKEVSLKDAQKLPAGSVLMFKFGTAPAMLIHHRTARGRRSPRSARTWAARCNTSRRPTAFTAPATAAFTTPIPAPTSAGRRRSRSSCSRSPSSENCR